MKTRIFRIGSILVLGLAAMTIASADDTETPGLDGLWFANVTNADCTTLTPNGPTFRALYMFGHDGSLTTEAAFFMPNPRRSSGLGAWQHTQAHSFASTFWFFRYNPDGSFLSLREISSNIQLNGGQFTSVDRIQDYDANNNVTFVGCAVSTSTRAQ